MKQAKSKTENAEALVLLLLESASLIERRLDTALSNIRGISFSEFRLLRSLSRTYAGTAMRVDLARAVGLTPSAVTRALKPLEKLGYVTTQKSDRDARRSLASLTAAGVELLADGQSMFEDVIAELPMNCLDYQQLVEFREGLAKKHCG
jgi:DNA-binding MarR family transcriptional regulator